MSPLLQSRTPTLEPAKMPLPCLAPLLSGLFMMLYSSQQSLLQFLSHRGWEMLRDVGAGACEAHSMFPAAPHQELAGEGHACPTE